MGSAVTDSLPKLLLRRSEGGRGAILWGREAQPHFGKLFDRLLADGILTERAPAATWPPCSTCPGHCGDRAIVFVDGRAVAECPEDHACDDVLDADMIRSFEIDPDRLCAALAGASGLKGEISPVDSGVWNLGRLPGGRTVMLALDPLTAADQRVVTLICARVEAAATTLLLPSALPVSQRQHLIDAGFCVRSTIDVLAASGFLLDHPALTPTTSDKARLVIGRSSRTAALDRRPRQLGDQPFRVLLKLADVAKLHDGFVEMLDIERAIYRDQILPAARETRDIIRLLRDQLAMGLDGAEAKAVRGLIENKRQPSRYRLALTPEEIDLRP
jgi:hypothetical protein